MIESQQPRGRFLYINGFLCKTEDEDGAFRPADIFSQAPVNSAAIPMQPCTTTTSTSGESTGGASPSDSDCFVFNTFGVLSGSVLVDAWDAKFIDCTDTDIYIPSMLAHGEQGPTPQRTTAAANDNMSLYTSHDTRHIRPEAVLTLCSSILPFPSPPLAPYVCDDSKDCVSQPSRQSRLSAQTSARGCIKHRLSKCSFPAASLNHKQRFTRFLQLWGDAESFRHTQLVTQPAHTFLPASIPFKFQYGGKPVACASGTTEDNNNNNSTTLSSSTISDFYCFTGKPSWVRGATSKPRDDVALRRQEKHSADALRRAVRPWKSFALNEAALHDWEVVAAPHLHPTDASSPWYRAWWVFSTYYHYLGITQKHGRSAYSLSPDDQYSVRQAVQARIKEHELVSESHTKEGTQRTSLGSMSDAWRYLVSHHKEVLLRRLLRIEVYLRKCQAYQKAQVEKEEARLEKPL